MTKLAQIKVSLIEDLRTLDATRPVDWDLVRQLAKNRGAEVTRQWLSRDVDIQSAYREALDRHRSRGSRTGTRSAKPRDLLSALDEIKVLKAKIIELDETMAQYDRKFIRYIDNARKNNISVIELEAE